MTFEQFQSSIHERGFQIVCLNDYKLQGDQHTFVAIQDKSGHGYHAEGLTAELSSTLEKLVTDIETSKGK